MPNYSKNDVVLVPYPFSDRSGSKVRPAMVIGGLHPSQDLFVAPLTSKTERLLPGEFVLSDWSAAGLNVPTAFKRALYTARQSSITKFVGRLASSDAEKVRASLLAWLEL